MRAECGEKMPNVTTRDRLPVMSSEPGKEIAALVVDWLVAAAADSVLLIGETAAQTLPAVRHAVDSASVETLAAPDSPPTHWLASLATRPRVAAAVMSDVADRLPEMDAALVIGRVRDVHASRMLLLTHRDPVTGAPPRRDLLALGLERLASRVTASGNVDAYVFDIDSYKRTPEWLNAHGWAHPELWDRYRW